jgi:cysteinyl-tRNA synthetase
VTDAGAPREVEDLARRRAEAREAKDFAAADALRAEIAALGWTVVDRSDGFSLELVGEPERARAAETRVRATDVPSVLAEPATHDVTVQWVCEGWPEDIDRALAAFRAHHADRGMHYVVADVTGLPPGRFGDDVEQLSLEDDTGWAAARNAALRRARGRLVLVVDGSIEPTGDVVGPLEAALRDPQVGLAGPFGIVTHDLREFEEAAGPGPCDAIEGYLMAFRREVIADAGGFDEKFRWYRTADVEWSFRVKDLGLRTELVPVPVAKHDHRMWFETPPEDRARWSKRNFYRFLDRWRDRWDLVLDPRRPDAGA